MSFQRKRNLKSILITPQTTIWSILLALFEIKCKLKYYHLFCCFKANFVPQFFQIWEILGFLSFSIFKPFLIKGHPFMTSTKNDQFFEPSPPLSTIHKNELWRPQKMINFLNPHPHYPQKWTIDLLLKKQ